MFRSETLAFLSEIYTKQKEISAAAFPLALSHGGSRLPNYSARSASMSLLTQEQNVSNSGAVYPRKPHICN